MISGAGVADTSAGCPIGMCVRVSIRLIESFVQLIKLYPECGRIRIPRQEWCETGWWIVLSIGIRDSARVCVRHRYLPEHGDRYSEVTSAEE